MAILAIQVQNLILSVREMQSSVSACHFIPLIFYNYWMSVFSARYGKLVEGMMVAGNNHIDKEDFLHLCPPAREMIFNQENIYSGFAGAGLKPLNQDRVLEKITFSFMRQHHHFLKVQYHLPSKRLRIIASLITSSAAYREAFRKESFLVVRYLIFNILRGLLRWL
jgi:hypothetical protein